MEKEKRERGMRQVNTNIRFTEPEEGMQHSGAGKCEG